MPAREAGGETFWRVLYTFFLPPASLHSAGGLTKGQLENVVGK